MFKLLIIVVLSYINGYSVDEGYNVKVINSVINTVSILNENSDKSLVDIEYRITMQTDKPICYNYVLHYTIDCTSIVNHSDFKSDNDSIIAGYGVNNTPRCRSPS